MQQVRPYQSRARRFLKLLAAASVAILLSSTVASADPSGSSDADEQERVTEQPRSEWDFSVYNYSGEGFSDWAQGPGFRAFFTEASARTQLARIEDSANGWLTVEPRAFSPVGKIPTASSQRSLTKQDSSANYNGVLGADADAKLKYTVAWGGLKEQVAIGEKPEEEADFLFTSVVRYDDDVLTPMANGSALSGYGTVDGGIEFENETGAARFSIPQSFAIDSPRSGKAAADKDEQGAGQGGLLEWLTYSTFARSGELWVSVVVPWELLNRSDLSWPLIIGRF